MNLLEGIVSGIQVLFSHKMRTLLTLLGVMIGVAAVIGMVSVGDGAKTIVMEDSEKIGGATMVYFKASRYQKAGGRQVRRDSEEYFTLADAEAIEEQCPAVKHAVASIYGGARVSTGAGSSMREMYTNYQGVAPSYQKGMDWRPQSGRFISDTDVENAMSVCVVGQDVVNELFNSSDPIGSVVRLNNVRFSVIGVMEPRGRSLRFGWNLDESIFVPITTVQQRFTGNDRINLSIKAANTENVPKAIEQTTALLLSRHRNQEFFSPYDVTSGLEFVMKINKIIKILLTGVAGFSLLIGGIGVMNIMLVSVAERTREIGLRKAIGARRRDILGQFLIEAVLLCAFGGLLGLLLGIVFGAGVAWIVTSFIVETISWPSALPFFWAMVSLISSAVIGIFFGLYPAIRASRLDPTVALKME